MALFCFLLSSSVLVSSVPVVSRLGGLCKKWLVLDQCERNVCLGKLQKEVRSQTTPKINGLFMVGLLQGLNHSPAFQGAGLDLPPTLTRWHLPSSHVCVRG